MVVSEKSLRFEANTCCRSYDLSSSTCFALGRTWEKKKEKEARTLLYLVKLQHILSEHLTFSIQALYSDDVDPVLGPQPEVLLPPTVLLQGRRGRREDVNEPENYAA